MPQELSIDTALHAVETLLLGEDSIPIQLRQRRGLNRANFDRLVAAIELLIEHYRGKAEVPKRLALAFVDIANYFYFEEDFYSPEILEELEDAAHRLSLLGQTLFSDE